MITKHILRWTEKQSISYFLTFISESMHFYTDPLDHFPGEMQIVGTHLITSLEKKMLIYHSP